MRLASSVVLLPIIASAIGAQQPPRDTANVRLTSSTLAGLKLRSIGPALTSGRIADVAVDPTDKSTWYVASAAGGVWKSTNAGTSFSPIFDGEGSFSIGTVVVDPHNPNI